MSTGKTYGLIIPKKADKKKGMLSKPSIFSNDDDDEDEPAAQSKVIRKIGTDSILKRKTQLEIDKALEEDPNIYEYDAIYDQIQEDHKAKMPGLDTKKDKDKKPKYIEKLLKTASDRKKEYERRVERSVQKEREEEKGKYDDSESFVTAAYRKKMAEMAEEEERDRRQAMLEEHLDVTKQKDLSGFYRHLLKQTTGQAAEEVKVKQEADKEGSEVKQETDEERSEVKQETDQDSRKRTPVKEDDKSSAQEVDFSQDQDSSLSDSDSDSSSSSGSSSSSSRNRTAKLKSGKARSRSRSRSGSTQKEIKGRSAHSDSRKDCERDRVSRGGEDRHRRDQNRSREGRDYRSRDRGDRRSRSRSRERRDKRDRHGDEYGSSSRKSDRERRRDRSREKGRKRSSSPRSKSRDRSHKVKPGERSTAVPEKSVEKGHNKSDTKANMDNKNTAGTKFAKRNTGETVDDARARYLARKQGRHVAIARDNDGEDA